MRLTKLLASAIILQLCAFDALAFDAKISTQLPGFSSPNPTGISTSAGPYAPVPTGGTIGALQNSEVGSKQLIDPKTLEADSENRKAQAEQEAQACIDKTKNAGLACATMSVLTGMDAGTGAMIESLVMSQLPTLIGQLSSSGKSAAEQCKIQSDINKIVGTITTAKTVACVAMSTSCKNTCHNDYQDTEEKRKNEETAAANLETQAAQFDAALNTGAAATARQQAGVHRETAERLRRAKNQISSESRTCGSYRGNLPIMLMQAGISAINMIKSNQCADALSASVGPTATPISLVESNIDCSNPSYASTNPVCICRSNPGDAICGSLNNGGYTPGGGSVGGGSIATPGMQAGDGLDGSEVDQTAIGANKESGSAQGAGGGGGGMPNGGGGGGGGLAGGEGDGGAGSGLDKNVIQGTSGGSGVGALTAAGGGGGGGLKSGGGGFGGGGSGFDFKKYLPKSLFKNRGLAGMTVPSTDGITGPMGPSLWEKVTNRYQVKKSSLIQDK